MRAFARGSSGAFGYRTMSDDLETLRVAVCDEDSFVRFLEALATDRADEVEKENSKPSSPYGPGANGWENGTIEAFLECASAWARASKNGLPPYKKPDNPWKRCADIIFMGKIYEWQEPNNALQPTCEDARG
jgi:hypothetical protein